MTKTRLEAFSDGMIAIFITIMVLELHPPESAHWEDITKVLPHFATYVVSFLYLGIYWVNHHHMLHATKHVIGGVLWANLHLMFWLSLIPFATAWIGNTHFESLSMAIYGFVLLMSGLSYILLQGAIIRADGAQSELAKAVGPDRKGKLSLAGYVVAMPLAFLSPWISGGIYAAIALMWLVPDRRIESKLEHVEKPLTVDS